MWYVKKYVKIEGYIWEGTVRGETYFGRIVVIHLDPPRVALMAWTPFAEDLGVKVIKLRVGQKVTPKVLEKILKKEYGVEVTLLARRGVEEESEIGAERVLDAMVVMSRLFRPR